MFDIGQVWRYATRDGEESSRIQIVALTPHERLGVIVGIAITNLRPPVHGIGHVPIATEALERSGLALEQENAPLPDFEEGYAMWKSEFDQGRAGIFTGTVKEVVEWMETAVTKGTPPSD